MADTDNVMYINERYREMNENAERLKNADADGNYMTMEVPMKDYVDARDDAVESRLSAQLGGLATLKDVRGNIWGAAAAIIGIILAVLAFGSDRFNGGLSISPVIATMQAEQRKTDQSQDAKLEMMNRKLDILIDQTKKN